MNTRLTDREMEIAELVAWGCSADEAADKLGISPFTIKNTLRNIYMKLGLGKTTELGAYVFCKKYGVSASCDKLGHVRRAIGASLLLGLFLFQLAAGGDDLFRGRRLRRRQEFECYEII